MTLPHPPELRAYFDRAIDKIEQHPTYSKNLEEAAKAGETLVLNFHTHGPGQGYCASVCVAEGRVPTLGWTGTLRELAHLRGIAQEEEDCELFMAVFADALVDRYELARAPETWLNGKPFAGP